LLVAREVIKPLLLIYNPIPKNDSPVPTIPQVFAVSCTWWYSGCI